MPAEGQLPIRNSIGRVLHTWPQCLPDGDHFLYRMVSRIQQTPGSSATLLCWRSACDLQSESRYMTGLQTA
jgi:hypothetical protein